MYKDLLEADRSVLSGWLSNLRNCISHIYQGTRAGHINVKTGTKQPSSVFSSLSSYTSLFCMPSHESVCDPSALKSQPYRLIKISSDLFRLFKDCSCFYYMTSSMTLHWTLIYHLFTPNSLLRAAVCACSQCISWRLYPLNQQALLCCALSHLSSVMLTFLLHSRLIHAKYRLPDLHTKIWRIWGGLLIQVAL